MTKKGKVLIVGPGWPLRGGLATFDERLCREFQEQGYGCEILSFSLQYPSLLFPGKTQYSESPAPEGVTIHADLNSINPINWIQVGMKFRKNGYNLVVFRYWMSFMGPAYGTLARIFTQAGITCLAITDNIVPHEKKFFDKPFTSYFLRPIQGYLTMSEEVLGQIRALQPLKPSTYVPHPMYDMFGPAVEKQKAIQELGLNAGYRYLLFFGFIRKYKGLELLLESLAQSNWKALKLKLIIAGEFYEDSKPYLQKIKDLGLEEAVVLNTDFIPNERVSYFFSASELVIQTYLSATQSGVTQIAYYYEKPMLVTRVGGLAELVPHNVAGLVCGVNAQEIASEINRFFTENLENILLSGIRENKKRFTWQYLCGELIGLGKSNSSK